MSSPVFVPSEIKSCLNFYLHESIGLGVSSKIFVRTISFCFQGGYYGTVRYGITVRYG